MIAIRRHRLSKSIQTVRHGNLAMLCSEAQCNFHLLNKSLAAGAHHVEVNVYDATMQMCAGLDGGGVIAVLPDPPYTCFSAVLILRGTPGDQLHTADYDPFG